MPDGRMGMHHPGFPRIPKVFSPEDKKKLAEPPVRVGGSVQGSHSHTDYMRDRAEGGPFGVGDITQSAHGNHDTPGRDRNGPVNKPGSVHTGKGKY